MGAGRVEALLGFSWLVRGTGRGIVRWWSSIVEIGESSAIEVAGRLMLRWWRLYTTVDLEESL